MKLITTLSMTAFVLAPVIGIAKDSAGSSSAPAGINTSDNKAYPYPDWAAVKKTAEPQKNAGQDANKSEPSLVEKAGKALETMTGRSNTQNEGASQGAASPAKEAPAGQNAESVAPMPQKGADQEKTDQNAANGNGEPSLVEKASRALQAITGGAATMKESPAQENASQTQPVADQNSAQPNQQNMNGAPLKTAEPAPKNGMEQPKSAEKASENSDNGKTSLMEKAGRVLETVTGRSTVKEDSSTTESASQGSATQGKPAEAAQHPRQGETVANTGAYPYPDWPAIKKTAPAPQEQKK